MVSPWLLRFMPVSKEAGAGPLLQTSGDSPIFCLCHCGYSCHSHANVWTCNFVSLWKLRRLTRASIDLYFSVCYLRARALPSLMSSVCSSGFRLRSKDFFFCSHAALLPTYPLCVVIYQTHFYILQLPQAFGPCLASFPGH